MLESWKHPRAGTEALLQKEHGQTHGHTCIGYIKSVSSCANRDEWRMERKIKGEENNFRKKCLEEVRAVYFLQTDQQTLLTHKLEEDQVCLTALLC